MTGPVAPVLTRAQGRPARGRRSTVLIVLVVVVGSALAVWLGGGSGHDGPLDPRNPGPAGAEATARVLADRGVAVDVVRGQDALLDTEVDARTTVVVTDAGDLGTSTLRTLERHTRTAGTVVVVGDGTAVSTRFPAGRTVERSGALDADCTDRLVADLRVQADHDVGFAGGPGRCFAGLLLSPGARTHWLPAGGPLRNDRVLDGDNAALGLRLLGQQPRLVWYVADPADERADDAGALAPLLPDWLLPGLCLLGAAGVALLLWQGRRLGPLAREPLPVVVRAAETTESRGRLYRRARDRDHAARVLRAATRRRLAHRLALPAGAGPDAVSATVADTLGRPRDTVAALVEDQPVRTDTDLATLGRDLLRLEEEVHDR
ncbi:hypothetical protein GCM10011519_16210 [Marmoricola endophyticus]|uniref:DUF4350 domain-containing protein n=1 Tax=Marmoricola endophyticus TaxID=2040280 RepID=A0A917BJE6_9ACTN|nr:DUF4350 domain-containing protein [Marmoricola endophyticus]GGF43084.1 hypothetical protein GCM10011519_16210 [Marmoricola endophyticus]